MSAPLTDSGQGMAPGRGWLRLPTQLRIAGQEVPLPPLSSLAVPMLAVVVLAMMLLPLPAPVLDFLFTFNIASSLLVLLVVVYTGCLLLVLSAMLTEMMFTGRGWSNTYIVRLFATMQQTRERISSQNP